MTKKIIASLLLAGMVAVSCSKENIETTTKQEKYYFAIANRGDASVSIFDASSMNMDKKISLPNGAEPTYVSFSKEKNMLFVGDFKNEKLLVIDPNDFMIKKEITIGKGAFHMWVNDQADQLWINNIVDKTTSVINTNTYLVEKTIALPTDMNLSDNAVQHDVTISHNGSKAYITILDGEDSYIIQYSTNSFTKEKSLKVGGDAHLFATDNEVFALSQDAGAIYRLNESNLSINNTINYQGAHGVFATDKYLYAADVPGKSLGILNLNNNTIIQDIATDIDKPHNVAVAGNHLVVTHTGTNMIGFYAIGNDGKISLKGNPVSGANTFGLVSFKK